MTRRARTQPRQVPQGARVVVHADGSARWLEAFHGQTGVVVKRRSDGGVVVELDRWPVAASRQFPGDHRANWITVARGEIGALRILTNHRLDSPATAAADGGSAGTPPPSSEPGMQQEPTLSGSEGESPQAGRGPAAAARTSDSLTPTVTAEVSGAQP